jgi:signal peptidase I
MSVISMSPWSPAPSPHSFPVAILGRMLRAMGSGIQILGLLAISYAVLFHVSVVRGSSMTPGIEDGDRILVDHLSYVIGDVRRGDIAVLRCPVDEHLDYIKRVIGLPGDRVRIEDGVVSVNGEPLSEPYVVEPCRGTTLEQTVASDHFFVLGDNREHSADSREFGQVPRRLLRGRVDLRVWPPERAGAVR